MASFQGIKEACVEEWNGLTSYLNKTENQQQIKKYCLIGAAVAMECVSLALVVSAVTAMFFNPANLALLLPAYLLFEGSMVLLNHANQVNLGNNNSISNTGRAVRNRFKKDPIFENAPFLRCVYRNLLQPAYQKIKSALK